MSYLNLAKKSCLKLEKECFLNKKPTKSNNTEDEYLLLHKKCLATLSKYYVPGTFEYIEAIHPDMFQKLRDIEDRLDELWGYDIEAFEDVAGEYYNHNLELTNVFKERRQLIHRQKQSCIELF